MKILITGGAGYVGTTLIPELLALDHEVTVFDNLMYGGDPLIPFFRRKKFSFIKGDVRDAGAVKQAVKDNDAVIHLAAIVGFPACRENPDLAKAVNVGGTKNMVDAMSPSQLLLQASTGSNYGKLSELTEPICTEESPLKPLSVYGQTKTEAENIAMDAGNTVAFRYATAFGLSPRMRLDLLINELVYMAAKQKYLVIYEANFKRTFIHVQDIARTFTFALENYDKMKGQVYNAGSEKMNMSKKEIAELIAKKTGAYLHFADVGEDQDKRNYVVSYKKINSLGYDITISVEEGIDELVKVSQVVQISNPYMNI
jgi:nucleoside-diphosphate-sugar epimerase